MTIELQTLLAVVGALVVPSLGGVFWLVRALGKLSSSFASVGATVDAFGLKLDSLAVDQASARSARGEIRATLADHNTRLTVTERDVERWMATSFAKSMTPGGKA